MAEVLRLNTGRIRNAHLKKAAEVVRGGGVIIYPTDTIYGLGCDAFDRRAVKRIFKIKRRSENNPALVLVSDRKMAGRLAGTFSSLEKRLMKDFWPGPLTIVFKARKALGPRLMSAEGEIGLRIPDSRFCLRLIGYCGTPIVSTSVNIAGSQPVTKIKDIVEKYSDSVDLIIDAGDLRSSVPSTVVKIRNGKLCIIREGAFSKRKLSLYAGIGKERD